MAVCQISTAYPYRVNHRNFPDTEESIKMSGSFDFINGLDIFTSGLVLILHVMWNDN